LSAKKKIGKGSGTRNRSATGRSRNPPQVVCRTGHNLGINRACGNAPASPPISPISSTATRQTPVGMTQASVSACDSQL
jgi:hypothetical protein